MTLPTSPVAALDAVLDAARRLERAETHAQERLAADAVRAAINAYDGLVSRVAAALSGRSATADDQRLGPVSAVRATTERRQP